MSLTIIKGTILSAPTLGQLDALLVEIDDGLRGHQPLTDDDGVALALQQLVKAGAGAVLQGVAILD